MVRDNEAFAQSLSSWIHSTNMSSVSMQSANPACRSFTPTLKQFCEAVEETQGAALVSTAAVSVTTCRV